MQTPSASDGLDRRLLRAKASSSSAPVWLLLLSPRLVRLGLAIAVAILLVIAGPLIPGPTLAHPPAFQTFHPSPISQVFPPERTEDLDSSSPSPANVADQQIFSIPNLWQTEAKLESRWVRLDGVRLFQIAGWESSGLGNRHGNIQRSLNRMLQRYLYETETNPLVEVRQSNQQPVIYVNDQYLLTVTELDAQYQGISPQVWAEQVRLAIAQGLETAQTQRQWPYLKRQAQLGLAVLATAATLILLLSGWSRRLRRRPIHLLDSASTLILKQRSRKHQTRLHEVQRLLILASQGAIAMGAIAFSISRFPQTRIWLLLLGQLLKAPLIVMLSGLLAYLFIRLSHIAIDRISLAISQNPLLPSIVVERTQQRISTLSQVVKGVALLLICILMLLISLAWVGINVGPLLAGAGILGVGISLASQGLIKDAINGVLIIFEDQYGVGDIVQIDEWTGLVESLNLRMTQLRTSEGKLVTIPNGEIKIVANLSNNWSQVDLNIPVAYEADLKAVIAIIESTALTMSLNEPWASLILEPPQLKGVEDFSDRGLLVKLWIKTQPLKQWDVAREYRLRLKQALDQAGLEIPLPQRAFWIHPPHVLDHHQEGER